MNIMQYVQFLPYAAATLVGYLLYQSKKNLLWGVGGAVGGYFGVNILLGMLAGGGGGLPRGLPNLPSIGGLTPWLPWVAAALVGWLAHRQATRQGANPSWWVVTGVIAGHRLGNWLLQQVGGAGIRAQAVRLVALPILPGLLREIGRFWDAAASLFG